MSRISRYLKRYLSITFFTSPPELESRTDSQHRQPRIETTLSADGLTIRSTSAASFSYALRISTM
jgi:hypothetical protein